MTNQSTDRPANALLNETSPYLQQHAYNPVDWRPWSVEALAEARAQGKLVIVSVGYATCHWCHVMERESFEDQEVADLMNEHFISIKVDREERPDLDELYMMACQLTSKRGCGWPLNAVVLPDGRPVWAGTYYPKEGWIHVLSQFVQLRQDEPARLLSAADQITNGLLRSSIIAPALEEVPFDETETETAGMSYALQLDRIHGGRRGAPKFPMPSSQQWLVMHGHLHQRQRQVDLIHTAGRRMAQSGIFDQLGGGFARYATDEAWKVPHFEKMLYDNGQLLDLYSDLYRIDRDALYKQTIEKTAEWIANEMTAPNGGFYSAMDADSEGVEGKYYVWTLDEIKEVLPDHEERAIVIDRYGISPEGNWEHGMNILHAYQSIPMLAEQHEISEREVAHHLKTAHAKLFAARSPRVRPITDDKILTSWNALCSHGLLSAYATLGDERLLTAACKNIDFILHEMRTEQGGLLRSYHSGEARIQGFLEDYATMARTCISCYEMTLQSSYLTAAKELVNYAITYFYDDERELFYIDDAQATALAIRQIQTSDNVIPSSNSMMAHVILKLAHYYSDSDLLDLVHGMAQRMLKTVHDAEYPSFFSNWWRLYDILRLGYVEVTISGPSALAWSRELRSHYLPAVIIAGNMSVSDLPILQHKEASDDTLIYICHQQTCLAPVHSVSDAVATINSVVQAAVDQGKG